MKFIGAFVLLVGLAASIVFAQTAPLLLDTNVTYRPERYSQCFPAIAFDGQNFIVVWHDLRNMVYYYSWHGESTAYWHICGCRVNPQGILLDSAGIFISYYINMVYPMVVIPVPPGLAYGGGLCLATWSDYRGSEAGIYGARIDTSGTVLDPDGFMIVDDYTWANTSVAFNGTHFLVTWASASGVYGCRVTPDGVILDPSGITVSAIGECLSASVAYDGTNYLVVWGTWVDVYGARVDTGGNVLDTVPIAICPALGGQPHVDIAFDGRNYLIVWQSGTTYPAIYGARVNPAGVVLDTNGIVISTLAACDGYPSVDFDGTNYLVAWAHGIATCCARVDTTGTLVDTVPIVVSIDTIYESSTPAAAFGFADHFIAWHTGWSLGDVFGARVDTSGVVIDTNGILLSLSAYPSGSSAAAFDGDNYLAVWTDLRDTTVSSRIYGTRIDTAGAILDPGGVTVVKGGEPAIAFDGSNYLVLCSDTAIRGARIDGGCTVFDTMTIYSIYPNRCNDPAVLFDGTNYFAAFVSWPAYGPYVNGLRIDTSGVVLDSVPIVVSHGGAYDLSPAIAFDGTNYFVVWFHGTHESTFDVYGARVTTGGVLLDTVPIVIAAGTYRTWFPSVAFDGTNYFVVWQDNRSGVYGDIYGARVTPEGVVLDPGGIPICTAASGQYQPRIAFDGTNYCVVWEDWRNGNYTDIYGCHLTPAGQVLSEFVVSGQPNLQLEPCLATGLDKYLVTYSGFVDSINGRPANTMRIWGAFQGFTGVVERAAIGVNPPGPSLTVNANPVRHHFEIRYALAARSRAVLSVFDAAGRRVRMLVDGEEGPGVHAAVFDARDLAQGVYFVHLALPDATLTKKVVFPK